MDVLSLGGQEGRYDDIERPKYRMLEDEGEEKEGKED
jgi:nitrogen fixation-related uncharacterized protein